MKRQFYLYVLADNNNDRIRAAPSINWSIERSLAERYCIFSHSDSSSRWRRRWRQSLPERIIDYYYRLCRMRSFIWLLFLPRDIFFFLKFSLLKCVCWDVVFFDSDTLSDLGIVFSFTLWFSFCNGTNVFIWSKYSIRISEPSNVRSLFQAAFHFAS